jgi:hypothetical protein
MVFNINFPILVFSCVFRICVNVLLNVYAVNEIELDPSLGVVPMAGYDGDGQVTDRSSAPARLGPHLGVSSKEQD